MRINRFRAASARESSLSARSPPIFPNPSFFKLIVHPSASLNASFAISLISTSLYLSSLCDTNHAFSAKRQASSKNILLYFEHRSFTFFKLSMDTGCPPPVLLVIVIKTKGTFSLSGPFNSSSSLAKSIFPLKGDGESRSRPSSQSKSIGLACANSKFALVVSK